MNYEIKFINGYWVVFKNGVEQCGRPDSGWCFYRIHQATRWIAANFERFGFEEKEQANG